MSKLTIEEIRARLTMRFDRTAGTQVLLGDTVIGNIVSFGRGPRRRTVYASRIYGCGPSIEEEGASPRSVLDKVARKLAAAYRAGQFTVE